LGGSGGCDGDCICDGGDCIIKIHKPIFVYWFMMNLPIEIVNKIINYTGVVTFYKGKYYNKIPKNDKRYKMLASIIKPPTIYKNVLIRDLRKNIGESYNTPRIKLSLILIKNNANEIVREELRVTKCGRDGFHMETYVLSVNNYWAKLPANNNNMDL
jgi:hypothetical protein